MKWLKYLYPLFLLLSFPLHAQANAAIAGTVTDSVTTLPLSGALVEAIRGNSVRYSTTTALNGTYTLSNIEPSNYTLVFSAAGYQTYSVGANPNNNQTLIVDASLVPIGGAIGGTVIDAISMLPIAGASIYIFHNGTLLDIQTTNGAGMYIASDLAPGNYVVLASASGFQAEEQGAAVIVAMTATADFALEPNPGSITGQVTDALTSNPIQDAQIGVYLDSTLIGFDNTDSNGNYTVSDLAPGYYAVVASSGNYSSQAIGASVASNAATLVNFALEQPPGSIAGTVLDANTTAPIPGAAITIFQDEVIILTLLTDPDGNYEAPGLTPGDYFVAVQADNYQSSGSPASVSSNSTTLVNFSLAANPGSLFGTITDAITTNPIPGARILLFSNSQLIAFAVSDGNGAYDIPDLAPGTYLVLVRAPGYRAAFSSEVVMAGAATMADFALNGNPGGVQGTILNVCDGSPVAGALVSVADGSNIVGFALTDENGNYTVDGLAPGNYTVAAAKQNFFANSDSAVVIANALTPVDLSLTPKALPPESISGEVIMNRFLTRTEEVHAITWTASPGFCVTGYEVYRNGLLIAFIPASDPLTYLDRNRRTSDVYTVKTLNTLGGVSAGISILLGRTE